MNISRHNNSSHEKQLIEKTGSDRCPFYMVEIKLNVDLIVEQIQ